MAHRVARRQFFRLEGGESEAGGRARAGFGYLENFFSLLALVFGFWFLVSVVLRRRGGHDCGARECIRGRVGSLGSGLASGVRPGPGVAALRRPGGVGRLPDGRG